MAPRTKQRTQKFETRAFLQTRLPDDIATEMRMTALAAGITSARLYQQIISGFLAVWRGRNLDPAEFKSPPWQEGAAGASQVNMQLTTELAAEVLEKTRSRRKGEGVSTSAFLHTAVLWFRKLSKEDKQRVLETEIVALPREVPIRISIVVSRKQARTLLSLLGQDPATPPQKLATTLAEALQKVPETI